MTKDFNNIKCYQCKYHISNDIHGHGEYYGSCRVLSYLLNKIDWYLVDSITSDDDDCIILKHLEKTFKGRVINYDE